jgi:hypothetical protein
MPSIIPRIVLFVSSFSPLLMVFALLDTFGPGWPSRACWIISFASIGLLYAFLRYARRIARVPICVALYRRRDQDVVGYVATYLIPFITFSADSLKEQLAVGIFILLIAVLYMRGEFYYLNPILAARGYRALEIETPGRDIAIILTRRNYIQRESELRAIPLGHQLYWEAA